MHYPKGFTKAQSTALEWICIASIAKSPTAPQTPDPGINTSAKTTKAKHRVKSCISHFLTWHTHSTEPSSSAQDMCSFNKIKATKGKNTLKYLSKSGNPP